MGETMTLSATVNPSNASDKTVTWYSSDASVATVEDGKVTAIKIGTATIKAKAGDKTATCSITIVPTEVFSITLDKSSASLKVGETVTLIATVGPEDATDKTVTWTTSDATVATVSNGVVTAKKLGTATITAKAGEKTATCSITVIPTPVTSVTLSNTSASLKVGETVTLSATVNPSDVTDKTVTWTTSDATVATVSNGVVTAKKIGTATITAKAGDKTATCSITVIPTPVTSVTLSKTSASLKVGETVTLTATVGPDDATDKTVTWTISDATVATVSNGVVTAKKMGTATITAKAGEKTATCTITVIPTPVTSVTLSKTTASLKVGETVTLAATVNPS
ncbi:MAG: Ig domain-containing protein, partial [Candidatus Cryptobacteroides sp.]